MVRYGTMTLPGVISAVPLRSLFWQTDNQSTAVLKAAVILLSQ